MPQVSNGGDRQISLSSGWSLCARVLTSFTRGAGLMEPRIQYAKTKRGVSIAYLRLGEGKPFVYMQSLGVAPSPQRLFAVREQN